MRLTAKGYAIAIVMISAGCVADADTTNVPTEEQLGLPETVMTPKGQEYLRADLWPSDKLERMERLSRASLGESPTLEEVAEGLRAHMRHSNGGIYIESVLDYELAEAVIKEPLPIENERGTRPGSAETRIIIDADTRSNISSTGNVWQSAMMFAENGCSGTRIGQNTALTAAHCVYRTLEEDVDDDDPDEEDKDGWICDDGSDHPLGCAAYPSWRFGVDGTDGHSNWHDCALVYVSSSFKAFTGAADVSGAWLFARHDYAVFDLSACPAGEWPNGQYTGTVILDNSGLAAATGYAPGYGGWHPCPPGASGTQDDCEYPGTLQYSGTFPNFTGAQLLSGASPYISEGDYSSAYTIRSGADTTKGHSGGMLYRKSGSLRQLIGICSNSDSGGNRYRRWTQSLFNWVAARSEFPDDT